MTEYVSGSGAFGLEIDTDELNANVPIVPIGGIIAWHKDFANTPAISSSFVECNGQVLSDADSPYNGQTIPDLNQVVEEDEGYFLRGKGTNNTGTTEASQNKAHDHTLPTCQVSSPSAGNGRPNEYDNAASGTAAINSSGGTEARPAAFVVVWIMRVK